MEITLCQTQTRNKIIKKLRTGFTHCESSGDCWLFSHSLLRWSGMIALALALAFIIDQILPLPRLFRMGLVLLWLGIGVYAAFRYLIQPVFQKLTDARVAAYVERSISRS